MSVKKIGEIGQIVHTEIIDLTIKKSFWVSFVYGSNEEGDRTSLLADLSQYGESKRNLP